MAVPLYFKGGELRVDPVSWLLSLLMPPPVQEISMILPHGKKILEEAGKELAVEGGDPKRKERDR